MTSSRSLLLAALLAASVSQARANSPGDYVPETDPAVLRKLEQWKDWKFGFMMHWGPYSQWGIVESWSICSEDVPWCKRPPGVSYVDYVKRYEQLPETFNPVKFDPQSWARVAEEAGTKYVVFTTKHHDGFNMFDTRQSDYRITAPNVPFHGNPRANITKQVFDAFHARGFGIGAYFSKPDWHNKDYWAPEWATPNRNVNYDPGKYPERWKRFVTFTHAQIEELTTGYGPLDILWLDGGWVRPKDPTRGEGSQYWSQDIDMPGLTKLARMHQPGLIVVDRAVGGPYENYRTPEQEIPDKPLPYPWETCMTLGDSWSYTPNDNYKPARKVVQMLVDVVAKGGNYLLNVGPDANGELPPVAVQRLREIGQWMRINGEAIYASRAVAPYVAGRFRYTALRDGTVYAIYLPEAAESQLPARLEIPGPAPATGASVRVLGDDTALTWRREGDRTVIEVPASVRKRSAGGHAWAIKLPGAVPASQVAVE